MSLLGNAVAVGLYLRLAEVRALAGWEDTALPLAVRRDFVARAEDTPALLADLASLGAVRREMVAAGAAAPLDEAALRAAMAEMRRKSAEVQARSHALLFEVLRDRARAEGRLTGSE